MAWTIVIVDDHPTFRRFVRRLLEQAGFEVVGEAGDGGTALSSVPELAPDVVLLDVMLPDMSGVEVAEQLASCAPSVRVVLTSSRSAEDLAIDSRGDGVPFVCKDDLPTEVFGDLLGGGE